MEWEKIKMKVRRCEKKECGENFEIWIKRIKGGVLEV